MRENKLLVMDFTNRYLSEYDNKYARANLPLNQEFLHDVEYVLLGIGGAIGAGFLAKLGSDLYDQTKSALFDKIQQKYKKTNDRVVVIEGEGRDKTILDFGKIRPFFTIGKGNIMVLKNLTILYEGEPQDMIHEEIAPSFFAINVLFKQKGHEPK